MIYVMSGGGTKLFAAIGVTYPAGSTLTCTNGTKTLKAKTTTGQWVFAIPEAGTWTVTATDGTDTKSQAVAISTEGQFESVELSYALVLFDKGTEYNTDKTGGFVATNKTTGVSVGSVITLTSNRTYFGSGSSVWGDTPTYRTNKLVSLGEHEYFCVNIASNENSSSFPENNVVMVFASSADPYDSSAWVTNAPNLIAYIEVPANPSETGTFKLDISEISSAMLGVAVYGTYGGQVTTIDKIWLE